MSGTGGADIRVARQELLDLAAAMRPGWPSDELSRALAAIANSRPAARTPEQHWCRALLAVTRLMTQPDGEPRALLDDPALIDPYARVTNPDAR